MPRTLGQGALIGNIPTNAKCIGIKLKNRISVIRNVGIALNLLKAQWLLFCLLEHSKTLRIYIFRPIL
jgi:hypothetical protein